MTRAEQQSEQPPASRPAALRALAQAFDDGLLTQLGPFLERRFEHYRLIGMGGSYSVAAQCAAWMRSLNLDAAAERASSWYGFPMDENTLTIAVSSSGATTEVLDRLDRLDGHFPVLAITNVASSPLTSRAGAVLPIHAAATTGTTAGANQHAALVLHALAILFSGGLPDMVARDLAVLTGKVADATEDLLDRRADWSPAAAAALGIDEGPDGEIVCLAPAERISSAELAALALRRGAGLAAGAIETADYWHTGPVPRAGQDPRTSPGSALLFTGSGYEKDTVNRLIALGTRIVAIGAGSDTAELTAAGAVAVRFRNDAHDKTALHTEAFVAELLADSAGD